jgi:hypothetical protein
MHHTNPDFWVCYRALPSEVRALADKAFGLLKQDPYHPSLRFKKIGKHWSARVGVHYRALAIQVPDGFLWFWIGAHGEYDKLLG